MTPTVDQQLFRQTLSQFATGVTVVSFMRDGEVCGMTVNSFASVSLDPPLILFCPALTTRFALGSRLDEPFTVSILAENQKAICRHYAGRGGPDLQPWQEGETPPVVAGCIAWLRCRTTAFHTHGDHLVVIGGVSEFGIQSTGTPLLFFRGEYPMLTADSDKASSNHDESYQQEGRS